MNELERFFNSIKYQYNTDSFNGATVEKVVLNKREETFDVYLRIPCVINYDEITKLFECAKKGINGDKKCTIKISYDNVTEENILNYIKCIIKTLVEKRPSLISLEDNEVKLDDEIIILLANSKVEEIEIRKEAKNITKALLKYGIGEFEVTTELNEDAENAIKEEIKVSKADEVPELHVEEETPEEDSRVILGRHKDGAITTVSNIIGEQKNVIVEAYIFADVEAVERPTQKGGNIYIFNLKISDKTNSVLAKLVMFDEDKYKRTKKALKVGNWYRFHGDVAMDTYLKDIVLNIKGIEEIDSKDVRISDDAEVKRVELHAHTMMSMMDSVVDAKRLVKHAIKLGHKAVAVTDHSAVQAYPDLFHAVCDYNKGKEGDDRFKVLYGAELNIVSDDVEVVFNNKEYNLLEETFVVFDTETTGFYFGSDQMIEIGAVKIKNGEIIDRFDEFIDPHRPLPKKIIELTCITDEMVQGKDSEEEVTKRFLEWAGDAPMVAHNAKFDIGFMTAACNKYNLGEFNYTVVDTMSLARMLNPDWPNHKLQTLVRRYNIDWDEDAHHRADYDAEGTAKAFYKMAKEMYNRNMVTTLDIEKNIDKDELIKFSFPYHVSVLATNKVGLKNLFKLISFANTKYLFRNDQPKLPKHELTLHREGLLIGSGCINGEIFEAAKVKEDEELVNMMQYYDYIEVQPIRACTHLLQMESSGFKTINQLQEHIKRIIRVAKDAGKLVCATGDVHNLTSEDKIYRDIIVDQRTNGKLHPLNRKGITVPDMAFLTTEEMLEEFSFLSEEEAYEIVVTNPNKIADQIEEIEVIIQTGGVPFSPKIENSVETVKDMVYSKAKSWYGDPLPKLIEDRIEQELKGIIGGGFDVIYLIAQKLVKKSNDDGYLVGSRGSVGSSFVATMMGITEVNPLAAHYRCTECQHSIFEDDEGNPLGAKYSSGFDLPDKKCPKCGNKKMFKDGQDIPFATFLGFNADKVPDIDLNFSDLNQAAAHEYTKVLFGVDNVYRAGTIGTVAEKTAFGYVRKYCEDFNIMLRNAEIERLAKGCTGVKRTTGQHPGGIVVIPGYMDVYDFTPYQFPAEDPTSAWRTTHFDYHAIDEDVLKLDILGHTDPTQLRMLQDLTGIDVTTVPLDDKETMELFLSPKSLGVTKEQIMNETGTLGVPEFGTNFTIGMLVDTKPKTFAELLKISGLSHGTDVWLGNAQDLIKNKVVPFSEVIGCRDDIMVYLMYHGVEPLKAFKIMEFVRKGKASKDPDGWAEHVKVLQEAGIEDWYIKSCQKIKYMFPKAHAAAYVMSAFRIAYFKVHYPAEYYASYFSTRFDDFDLEVMIKGYDAIKAKMTEILAKGFDASNKETAVLETLKLALEATARGFKFGNIDIEKSQAKNYVIADDGITLISPFRTLDGLGDSVANQIIKEREEKPFYSIEDFANRGKVNASTMEKLRSLGIFGNLPESSQLSLF